MQRADWFGVALLTIFSLGVLYVLTKSRSIQRLARSAQLSAEQASTSANHVDDILKAASPPIQRLPGLSEARVAVLYQVAADHYISGNEILWAYLYYYFVGASVLALAWGAVYAANKAPDDTARQVVLITLASAGVALSSIWLFLLQRANSYRRPLRKAASDAEKAVRNETGPEGSFAVAKRHGENLGWTLGSTGFVVTIVPLFFVLVFLVLVVVAL